MKIRKNNNAKGLILSLSGRIEDEDIDVLKELIKQHSQSLILDLKEVSIVGRNTVKFLLQCEIDGIMIKHCPAYIDEWIAAEKRENNQ